MSAWSIALPAEVGAVGAARHWVRTTPFGNDDVELVVTELVTNAVLHARTPLTVTLTPLGTGVRVDVADGRVDRVPEPGMSGLAARHALDESELWMQLDAESTTGRGLLLVDALADGWGVETQPEQKVVWAVIGNETDLPVALPPVRVPVAEGSTPVRLVGVPARLVLTSAANLDDLIREVQLAGPSVGPNLPRLRELADELLAMTQTGLTIRAAALHAVEAGQRLLDVTVGLPAGSAQDVLRFGELAAELTDYCRTGALLSLAAAPEIEAFRTWCAQEMARQLDGAPAAPCPFPVLPVDDPDVVEAAAAANAVLGADPGWSGSDTDGWLAALDVVLRDCTSLQDLVDTVAREMQPAGVATASLCLLAPDGVTVELTNASGYAEDVTDYWATFPVSADLPASEVIRTGEAIYLRTVEERDARFPVFRTTPVIGDQAIAVLPLPRGCLVLGFGRAMPFTADGRRVGVGLAASVAAVITRLDGVTPA